jgi:acyl-CoA thioesterase I
MARVRRAVTLNFTGRARAGNPSTDVLAMRSFIRLATLSCSLVASVSLTSCGTTSPSAPSRPGSESGATVRHVVVLGDSLAVSPSNTENFPTALQQRLDAAGYRWRIVNAGVVGAVTADGVRRLDSVLTSDTGIVVLELGANDGLQGIPTATVEQNLAAMIERAQARGIPVLLCGMETLPAHGLAYTLAFHRLFPGLATRYGVTLVPFLLAGVALNPSLNLPDGIHPNSAGAKLIAETVWPYLERLVQQAAAAPGGAS